MHADLCLYPPTKMENRSHSGKIRTPPGSRLEILFLLVKMEEHESKEKASTFHTVARRT